MASNDIIEAVDKLTQSNNAMLGEVMQNIGKINENSADNELNKQRILSLEQNKVVSVKPWVDGETETDINQGRRYTDGKVYLPKTVPAIMRATGPDDDNWQIYTPTYLDNLATSLGVNRDQLGYWSAGEVITSVAQYRVKNDIAYQALSASIQNPITCGVAPDANFTTFKAISADLVAQSIVDQNGKDWFINDGFLVIPQSSVFTVRAGAGYVSGNRIKLDHDRIINVPVKPSFIYVDAHLKGPVAEFDIVVSADEKEDYTDGQRVKHFMCKVAQVLADGSVKDLRKDKDTNALFTKKAQPYKEGINVNNKLVRVEYKGVIYMPREPFVSFVTDTDFDISKWVVVNTANIPSIKQLTEQEISVTSYQSIKINSYHEGFNAVYSPPTGEGEFVWRPDLPKSLHDGGVYIDPTKTFPDFSNDDQLKDWFTKTNTGDGVFVRVFSGQYAVQWYGAIEGDYDNTHVFNAVTQAHLDYKDIIRKRITCYGVKFTVLGTVFLRLGQTLDFKGSRLYMGATGSIKPGYNDHGDKDPGGHPPYVMNLWCEGPSSLWMLTFQVIMS